MAQAVATQAPSPKTQTKNGRRIGRTSVADLIPGTAVNELYVVSDLQMRQGGKVGSYLTFRATDATGSVKGVYWPAEPRECDELLKEIEEGYVARVKGDVVSYRDRTEIRVAAPGGGISAYVGQDLDPEPFVPTSAMSEKELREAVETRIGLIADKHLRRLVRSFFADKERSEAFFRLPARLQGAHAHIRGLAEEAVEASRIASAAAGSVPGVDRDLVTIAALFAPTGAILAYQELGLAHEETRDGLLMPTEILSADLITRAAREAGSIPAVLTRKMRHIIVREPEVPRWGWASGPDALMPETVILHHALKITRTVPDVRAVYERKEGTVVD